MKKIKARIHKGKIHLDFEGFKGNECSDEEDLIRLLLAKLGVRTNVESSDNKREREAEEIARRKRIEE